MQDRSAWPTSLPVVDLVTRLSHMTKSFNVHEAKTHLSRLLDDALAGDDIVISKAGVPQVRLVPTDRSPRPRGTLAGVWPDLDPVGPFFDPLPDDEMAAWEQ